VARTSVIKHYGIKTLSTACCCRVRTSAAGWCVMRGVHDAGFEWAAHVRSCALAGLCRDASAQWTRTEFERGMQAFQQVFGFAQTHAAAGWQINAYGLELEREYALDFASDTRGRTPFWPLLRVAVHLACSCRRRCHV